jgi:hypothetical protein
MSTLPIRPDADVLRVTLRYDGPDVADGSIAVDDMVSAIQGFAGAYEKLAKRERTKADHRIRVTALEKHSADIVIGVWEWIGQNVTQLQGLSYMVGSAAGIVGTIGMIIKIRKHVAGKPFTVGPMTTTTISVLNSNHVSIDVSPRDFAVFQEKVIDEDVAKIVRPLRKGKIDAAELKSPQAHVDERIAAEDRESFLAEREIFTTKEDWIDGYLVSLNKESNTGTFRLMTGLAVPYRLTADKPEELYADFAYTGPVRVYGKGTFDEHLRPVRLEISRIERVQGTLSLTAPGETM